MTQITIGKVTAPITFGDVKDVTVYDAFVPGRHNRESHIGDQI